MTAWKRIPAWLCDNRPRFRPCPAPSETPQHEHCLRLLTWSADNTLQPASDSVDRISYMSRSFQVICNGSSYSRHFRALANMSSAVLAAIWEGRSMHCLLLLKGLEGREKTTNDRVYIRPLCRISQRKEDITPHSS